MLQWIAHTLNTQQEIATLENLPQILKQANYPTKAIISVGATRYTTRNEKRMLKRGDVVNVIVFNHHKYDIATITKIATDSTLQSDLVGEISVLKQKVV